MTNLVFTTRIAEGQTPSPQAHTIATIGLTWQERQRSRLAIMLHDGRAAAILLPRGETLADGDLLASECGQMLCISALPERLMKITASHPRDFIRLVYHLANRHVRAMLSQDMICIERDPVLADMVVRLGGHVTDVEQPFEPERGAYHGGPGHHHGHGHADIDNDDRQMGSIGEELSRQAHARR